MSMDKYKVDNLIILVGDSTFPCLLAAKSLLKEGGKVVLVHTQATEASAKRLRKVLAGNNVDLVYCLGEFDAHEINKSLNRTLSKLTDPKKKIGLHYTGGTKAMAVHAYRTVQEWERRNDRKVVYSYLNSRTLEMVFDHEWQCPATVKIENVASLKEIILLSHKDLSATEKENEVASIVATEIEKSPEFTGAEILVNSVVANEYYEFGIDVSVVVGGQLLMIACVNSSDTEVIMTEALKYKSRAKKLAGELAKVAVVSLANNGDLSALKAEIDSVKFFTGNN
ncbi:MAG: hypothetical protein WAZ19_16385, partial [Anaerolineae bacterium]